jgi:hypothetical protein
MSTISSLGAFVDQNHRLPRLGDTPAPWHHRGWLLAYVVLIHECSSSVNNRWGYHLRTLEARRLLDEPIPRVSLALLTPRWHPICVNGQQSLVTTVADGLISGHFSNG